MNYYPFHLGDYAAHTAHLEPMEDLAYRRMLDLYYRTEKPLPADWRDIARLIRMKDFGDEIEAVLSEFFVLGDAGWKHARCDAEILKMRDKQTKAKASAAASVNARQSNAQRTLNERSTNAELPTPTPTPKENTGGADSTVVAPAKADPPALLPDGRPKPEDLPGDAPPQPSLAGRACLAMRGANVHDVNPSHPDLLRLLAAGVTPEDIGATAAECAAKGRGRMAYVLRTIESRREAAALAPTVAAQPPVTVPSGDAERTAAYLAAQAKDRGRPPPDVLAKLKAMSTGVVKT